MHLHVCHDFINHFSTQEIHSHFIDKVVVGYYLSRSQAATATASETLNGKQ